MSHNVLQSSQFTTEGEGQRRWEAKANNHLLPHKNFCPASKHWLQLGLALVVVEISRLENFLNLSEDRICRLRCIHPEIYSVYTLWKVLGS